MAQGVIPDAKTQGRGRFFLVGGGTSRSRDKFAVQKKRKECCCGFMTDGGRIQLPV